MGRRANKKKSAAKTKHKLEQLKKRNKQKQRPRGPAGGKDVVAPTKIVSQENKTEASPDAADNEKTQSSGTAKDDPGLRAAEYPQSAKVISKGKAALIVSGADEAEKEATKPKSLIPEPRLVPPKQQKVEPVDDDAEQQEEVVSRLESKTHPGKERIKVDKAKFEKLAQRPDEAELQEGQWGRSIPAGWWVAIAGLAVAILLVAGLAIESWYDGDQVETIQPRSAIANPAAHPHEGSPKKWFYDQAGTLPEQARAVMAAFATAKSDEERRRLVRFPDLYQQRKGKWDKPFNPRYHDSDDYNISIKQTEDTAFVTVDCRDTDFMAFRAYFVRVGDQLKLDWSASLAWSQLQFGPMKDEIKSRQKQLDAINKKHRRAMQAYQKQTRQRKQALAARRKQENNHQAAPGSRTHTVRRGDNIVTIAKKYGVSHQQIMTVNDLQNDLLQIGQILKIPSSSGTANAPDIVVPPVPVKPEEPVLPTALYTEPMLVRCLIRRRDEFYAGPYNDTEHSAYMLTSPDGKHYVWAYTERDSDLDLELRRLLDHGRFVVDLKKDLRVTLRVMREQKDALPSQLKLVELLHPEWVSP